jgi:nucleotide-binding universal stress UspA family protein
MFMSQIIIGNTLVKNSLKCLRAGIELGRLLKSKVHVVHTDRLADFETLDTIFAHLNLDIQQNYIQNIIAANEKALENQIKELDITLDELTFQSYPGNADDVIVEQASAEITNLIVVGHDKNKSWAETFLGGVTEGILHKSSKSVLIVKDETLIKPKKILLAYDFSFHCNEALEWGKKMMDAYNCELEILNIVPCYYEGYHVAHTIHDGFNVALEEMMDESLHKIEGRLDELRKSFGGNHKVTINAILDKEGSISDKIINYIDENNHNLVILGSHKRGKISEIVLGSICNKVLKNVNASVLIAK